MSKNGFKTSVHICNILWCRKTVCLSCTLPFALCLTLSFQPVQRHLALINEHIWTVGKSFCYVFVNVHMCLSVLRRVFTPLMVCSETWDGCFMKTWKYSFGHSDNGHCVCVYRMSECTWEESMLMCKNCFFLCAHTERLNTIDTELVSKVNKDSFAIYVLLFYWFKIIRISSAWSHTALIQPAFYFYCF